MSITFLPEMKNKEIVFGVDVDEVLRSLLPGMVELYNSHVTEKEKKTIEEIDDFVVEHSFPAIDDVARWFFIANGHTLFRESPAINGAVEAVRKLRAYGKVAIITYQKTFENRMDTLQWLEDVGIEYDGLCFLKDKTMVHTDYLIDDNDWNFIGCNARNGILITAPYNKNKRLDDILAKSNCDTISRFGSLAEFAEWFDAENKQNTKDAI